MNAKDLHSLGFSENEAKIYLALLQYGSLLAGALSKKTQINRRTTYDTLERMMEKGVVSFTLAAERRVFNAVPPKIILTKLREMEEQAQKIIPELEQLYAEHPKEEEIQIYRGRKGIRSILNQILSVKEYVSFGSNERFPEIMGHDFLQFQKKKTQLKIKSRTLMSIVMKGNPLLQTATTEFRYLPKQIAHPTSTFIYDNIVAIVMWTDTPIAITIESKELARTYLHYFNTLWKTSQK